MKKLHIVLGSVAIIAAGAGYFGYKKAHEILTEKAEIAVVNSFKQLQQKELIEGAFFASLESGQGYVDIHKPRFILNDGLSKLDIESSGTVRVAYTLLGDHLSFETSDPLVMKVIAQGVEMNKASLVPDELKVRLDLTSPLYSLEKGSVNELLSEITASAKKIQAMDESGTVSYTPKNVHYSLEDERFSADLDEIKVSSKTKLSAPTKNTAINELIRLIEQEQRETVVDLFIDFEKIGKNGWVLHELVAESLPGTVVVTAKYDEENNNHVELDLVSKPNVSGVKEYMQAQYDLTEKALSILEKEENAIEVINMINSITLPESKLEMSGKDFGFFVTVLKNRLMSAKDQIIAGNLSTFNLSLDLDNVAKMQAPMLNHLYVGTDNSGVEIEKGLGDLYTIRLKEYETIISTLTGFANELLAFVPEAGKTFEEDKMNFTFKLPDATNEQIADVLKAMATVKSSKEKTLEVELRKKGHSVVIGTKPVQAYLPQFMGLGFGMGVALKQQLPEGFLNRFEITKSSKTVGEFGEENFAAQTVTSVKVHQSKPVMDTTAQ